MDNSKIISFLKSITDSLVIYRGNFCGKCMLSNDVCIAIIGPEKIVANRLLSTSSDKIALDPAFVSELDRMRRDMIVESYGKYDSVFYFPNIKE